MLRHLYLLKNPTFLRFFLGNAISLVGFGFNFIATGWIVLDMTGSKVAVGEMVAVSTLPGLVIALYAGTIIDRMNRKHLLVFLDLYRALAIIAIPILHWAGEFQLWQLYVMSFLTGTGSSIFWSCASAFTQELVKEKDFMSANSLLSASYQTGALLGSALGGFVVHAWGGHTALALDALTYIISAILIASAVHRPAPYLEKQEAVWETFKYGFRFLQRRKMIFVYGVTSVTADVAIWGALAVLTIALSTDVLHTGALGFGLMDGAYGVGALLSTLAALIITEHMPRKSFLIIAYFVAGLMCILLPSMTTLAWAMALYFIMGLHNNSARITSRTILMELIPNNVMGRAQTILGQITRLLVIVSTLFAGWIAEEFSVELSMRLTAGWFWISLIGVVITAWLRPRFFDKQDLEFATKTENA